ncbi:MAG TPA: hypothetical protein ENN25_00760 [Euryarchaeota archaeon]|nr:hypothetical protein [Euryarchaeota archaeon]
MAKGRIRFLNDDEKERIHGTSVRILEEIGVRILSDSVCDMLVQEGCGKSEKGGRILMPESVIESAVQSAPKTVRLSGRGEIEDIVIPSGRIYSANGGEGVYIKNLLTGEQRPSTLDDIRDFMIMANEFPQIDFCWGMVGALDQPAHIKELIELKVGFQYTEKHVQGGSLEPQQAEEMIELASILTGSKEDLRKSPIFSAIECPISPLTFEKGLAESQVVFSRHGIPVVSMSASLAGLTSPVTIAGTLTQVNAENLASLVISQIASRNSPWIYSSDSVPADFKSGSIDYGAFESHLLRTGAAEMGAYYGFPTMTAGLGIEETSLLLGTIQDGLPYMMIQTLVPTDLGSGFGGLNQAAGASFEQFVVDVWIWDVAREFARDFESDDEAISFETIRDASRDGTFINKPHTISRFKKEFLATTQSDAKFSGRKVMEHRGNLLKRASEEVEAILKNDKKMVVSKDDARAMDTLMKRSLESNH